MQGRAELLAAGGCENFEKQMKFCFENKSFTQPVIAGALKKEV